MKIRNNFWGCKTWYALHGGPFNNERIKLMPPGNTLEIKCCDENGIQRKGYYKDGRWIST